MMTENVDSNIERRIVIGLIVSDSYIQQTYNKINIHLIESNTARLMIKWCLDFYEKYQKAPFRDIEGIYFEQLKACKIDTELAEEIEEEILPDLSEEYEAGGINVEYLYDQTIRYFNQKQLEKHNAEIESLLDEGKVEEAQTLANNFVKDNTYENETDLDLNSTEAVNKLKKAFNNTYETVLRYPRALGMYMNDQLIRGGFICFFAPEKRGKTFWMMDMAVRAVRQKSRVAFFQAGDMTESQQLRRLAIHLAGKSDKEKYCGEYFAPVRDCVFNQLNDCDKKERQCDFGIFEGQFEDAKDLREEITMDKLKEAYELEPDYEPCHNCKAYEHNNWGAVWIEKRDTGEVLEAKEAVQYYEKFIGKTRPKFKLSTHANGTLTVSDIKAKLRLWESQDGFVPDLIIIDYADLLVSEIRSEYRHQQNEIWKQLRGLSQEKHCLLVTASQTDAQSYKVDTITMNNFSEDKRKLAHATAIYGLSQDKDGREKQMGILRINEVIARESDESGKQVHVLQSLRTGKPYLTSYF
jgi:hypothetical protein